MALNVAAGQPQLSGNTIGMKWAKKILVAFYATTFLSQIANTDYEGELKQGGDTVRIHLLPNFTSTPYVKGAGLKKTPMSGTYIDMQVNRARSTNIPFNYIDLAQASIEYKQQYVEHAGKKKGEDIETEFLADVFDDVSADNQGLTAGAKTGSVSLGVSGTPLALTKSNIIDKIVDLDTVLAEQNVPEGDNDYIIMPPHISALIDKSDLQNASLTGDARSIIRTGVIGKIKRFNIFKSNLLETTTDGGHLCHNMLFGSKLGITFAAQVQWARTIEDPDEAQQLIQSIDVYDWKVAKPEAVGWLYGYAA